ncbi:MAG: B12-binding domain-containing protein [Cyclonatronaceae bacterium]
MHHSISEITCSSGDDTPTEIIHSGIEWLHNHRTASINDEENPVSPEGHAYAAILLEDDLEKARTYIDELIRQQWNIEEIITDVVQNALSEIGSKWHTNQISSKRENTASKINRSVILDLLKNDLRGISVTGLCALYSPSGELHNLGLTLVGELLKNQGIDVQKFGPNIRDSEFITCLQTLRPDALAVSITMASDLPNLAVVLNKIRQNPELDSMTIVVGGYLAGKLTSKGQLPGADVITNDLREGINSIKKSIQVEKVTKSAYSSH